MYMLYKTNKLQNGGQNIIKIYIQSTITKTIYNPVALNWMHGLSPAPAFQKVSKYCSWLEHAHSVVSALCDPVDCSPPCSSVHGIFAGKNTGVGCHFLLQGIFPTQGSNLHLWCLLQWQVDSLHWTTWIDLSIKLPVIEFEVKQKIKDKKRI